MTYYTLAQLKLATEECCACGITFAMPADFQRRAIDDHSRYFYCPAGHSQHYTGKTAQQKLEDAQARETALRDQLHAAEVEAENARVRQMRERHRIANGVCPCCNRSFDNLRRHMGSQHPDFDPGQVAITKPFKCSCGRSFETMQGLRTHQGHNRGDDWWKPSKSNYWRHLTVLT